MALKKCKRLLMENINAIGSLNNDKLLRALLQVRNTPDPDCNVSPVDYFWQAAPFAFSLVNRLSKYGNPHIRSTWRDTWAAKEEAMMVCFSRSQERLNLYSKTP